MPFPPFVKLLVERKLTPYCKKKVPPQLRDQVRVDFKIRGNNVTLFQERLSGLSQAWVDIRVAQFRFDHDGGKWALYWPDRNQRWSKYSGLEPSLNLDDLITEVEKDPIGVFWG